MAILHRARTLSALMPRYAQRFRCLGPACEDTCCASWPVHIDKKTYKAYRQEATPELGSVLSRSLERLRDPIDNASYAVIKPEGREQRCPILKGGLCTVHAEMGESYLSDVCFTYPRVTHRFGGQLEHAMTLSCPESARLALLSEDAFDFIEEPVMMREPMVRDADPHAGLPQASANDIRIFCLNVLRTRELPLWQRLALLGVFCESLSRHLADGKQEEIPALLDQFIRLIETGEVLASLDAIHPNYQAQAMVFATLWGAKGFASPSEFQQSLIHQISMGLGANEHGQVDAETLVAGYRSGLVRLDRVLADAPFLLEHYLANEMFIHVFPFGTDDPYDNYLHLVARFGLLRLLLAAQCNQNGELPPVSVLVSTVQLHCRRFQHDAGYTREVYESLHDSGWARLDKLFGLLRT